MKTQRTHAARQNERGLATLIFIGLLGIMMVLVMAESRALYQLHREVKFMQQQQVKRLNGPATNTVAATITETK